MNLTCWSSIQLMHRALLPLAKDQTSLQWLVIPCTEALSSLQQQLVRVPVWGPYAACHPPPSFCYLSSLKLSYQ